MYGFFDKHGKKLLAVLAALLAMVFLLPAGFQGMNGGGGGHLGTIDGKRVNVADVQQAQQLLRSLDRLIVPVRTPDGQTQRAPAPVAVFGPVLTRRFEQDPLLLYLLLREAQDIGAITDTGALDRYFTAPATLRTDATHEVEIERVNPNVKEALREEMRQLMSVGESFNRAQLAVKVSRPMVNEELARLAQQVKVRVASFDAADYEKVVPAPTADELQRQFDAYKNTPPVATDGNPFGFGYQVPNKVAVQWLSVPTAEAAKAVEASRSPEKWEEDAYFYYTKNQAEFATPATQPSGTPTTRPYEQVKNDVMTALKSPLIESKKREIVSRISQRLAALAPATQPATGPSVSVNDPAMSFEAVQTLVDSVQKQTGVRPTANAPAGMLSEAELLKQPGFGAAALNDPTTGFRPASEYVFQSLKGLQTAPRTDVPAAPSLELGKPTPVFNGIDGLYVGRVVGYATAHPAASLDSVRQQVEKDVRHSRAFATAADAAQALLDKAKVAGGLDKTDAKGVQTSDWFSAFETTPPGLTGEWVAGIVGPAFDTLRGVSSIKALPTYAVSKLRKDGRAVVIEVVDVQTRLNTNLEPMARRQAEQMASQGLMTPQYVQEWFTVDAAGRRVGFVPDTTPQAPTEQRTNRPVNPLLPG